MVSRSLSLLSAISLFIVVLTGCEKETDINPDGNADALARVAGLSACDAFQYGESVFYYKEKTNNVAKPLATRKGTYGAFPDGLVIDPATGEIDINKSESGLKYRVWFKAKGSSDSCTNYVTISGVNYRSRVYNVGAGEVMAMPFYNGQSDATCPCVKQSKQDDCEFANDTDVYVAQLTNGKYKKPKGFEIDKVTGAIDLKGSIANGLFGNKPSNGDIQMLRIYYRLNDKSSKSLNYIDVRMHYYDKAKDIPSSVLATANVKTYATFRQAAPAPTVTVNAAMATGDGSDADYSKPRPPDIIIVGH